MEWISLAGQFAMALLNPSTAVNSPWSAMPRELPHLRFADTE